MPYETTWEDVGVYQQYSGVVTPGDRANANNEVLGDERFDN